ncbi:endonuclease domain-containing protein [Candidatus Beckwithbacteria bacterium]|nr:endonuclease domain-containing protein [Candidatus Beckwithbacteria bacterium]
MTFIKYQNYLKPLARKNRKNLTKAESILWSMILRKKKTGYIFHRQKAIGNYILDFYCPKLLIGIEIDGSYHNYNFEKDKERESYLNKLGIQIIRYTNDQVIQQTETVYYDLCQKLEAREKILPTFSLSSFDKEDKKIFIVKSLSRQKQNETSNEK